MQLCSTGMPIGVDSGSGEGLEVGECWAARVIGHGGYILDKATENELDPGNRPLNQQRVRHCLEVGLRPRSCTKFEGRLAHSTPNTHATCSSSMATLSAARPNAGEVGTKNSFLVEENDIR